MNEIVKKIEEAIEIAKKQDDNVMLSISHGIAAQFCLPPLYLEKFAFMLVEYNVNQAEEIQILIKSKNN